ncbi:MAG: hypothetical protein ACHQUC_08455 [Chlamydiales bacterium]
MSIDGVASYGEIYSLTDDDIELYDFAGVEWRGRNILDIRDDLCIKNIVRFAQVYLLTSLTNPARLPKLKAEIVEIFEATLETEDDDEDETSAILYRFDPISGTYHEIIGAERKYLKSAGKCLKKAGKKIEKGARKVKHAVGKKAREGGRWVREHPVETVVIVVAAATLGVGGAALAGAASGAVDSESDHDRDSNRDNKPSSQHCSSSDSISSTNYDPLTSEIQLAKPNWPPQDLQISTSNLLAQDLPSSWNDPYRISNEYNERNSSTLAQTAPNSLIHEPKTYSAPASITDIPKSSSYAASSKGALTNHLPHSSPPIDRHPMEFSMAQQSGINPSAFHSSLFPGYQEPQTHHLSSMPPQVTSATNPAKEEPWTDFVKGVSNGFPRGCVDSVKETPSTLLTAVKLVSGYALDPIIHPLKHLPGHEIVSQTFAVYETIAYLRTCEDGEVSKATGELIRAIAPEAHKLFTDWDNLLIEERGDLSAYCLGKYGTDFLLPIAAAKGSKVVGGVLKEASVLGRLEGLIGTGAKEVEAVGSLRMQVKPNTILPPPGRLVTELNVVNIQELIRVGQKTPLLAKELGFTSREIARLTQTGNLENTVAGAFENIVRDRAMLESLEKFRAAEDFLKPYRGQHLFETHAKELIQQTGIRTYPRPKGIPEHFLVKVSNNGAGIKYIDPQNVHISVRVMPGKPHSPFPHQREPYVIHTKHGNTLDKLGNIVSSDSPAAHIPVNEFNYGP